MCAPPLSPKLWDSPEFTTGVQSQVMTSPWIIYSCKPFYNWQELPTSGVCCCLCLGCCLGPHFWIRCSLGTPLLLNWSSLVSQGAHGVFSNTLAPTVLCGSRVHYRVLSSTLVPAVLPASRWCSPPGQSASSGASMLWTLPGNWQFSSGHSVCVIQKSVKLTCKRNKDFRVGQFYYYMYSLQYSSLWLTLWYLWLRYYVLVGLVQNYDSLLTLFAWLQDFLSNFHLVTQHTLFGKLNSINQFNGKPNTLYC